MFPLFSKLLASFFACLLCFFSIDLPLEQLSLTFSKTFVFFLLYFFMCILNSFYSFSSFYSTFDSISIKPFFLVFSPYSLSMCMYKMYIAFSSVSFLSDGERTAA